jgi:predicted nucleic acid-binding protein
MEEMLDLPIRVEDSNEQFRRAYDWATRANRLRTHDLQYVALAQVHGATVITFDGGVEQAAIERGVSVRVLR